MTRIVYYLKGNGLTGWKRRAAQALILLIAAAGGGFLVAASGVVPISASSGHWAITAWLLHFSMQRSVDTHTLTIKTPPLNNERLVDKGAGHFGLNCSPCHGSPQLQQPRIAAAMTPHPPYLPPQISTWEPRELFYIIKHGVKFTGMPAWPTQNRDDEVWAVVAFLQRLPDLDTAGYQGLTSGSQQVEQSVELEDLQTPSSVPSVITAVCARCHGMDGLGRDSGAFPILAQQSTDYMVASLQAYASGARHSGMMEPIAAGLSAEQIEQVSRYYHEQPFDSASREAGGELAQTIQRGASIASDGIPGAKVPACADCHGPTDADRNPNFPHLAGQPAGYIIEQFQLFQQRHRGGTKFHQLMYPAADHLKLEQLLDVAAYYESLKND